MLLAVLALCGLYAHVALLARGQVFDEGYRRTFVTREFAINPRADGFGPAGGLGLATGVTVDLVAERRFHERFGWTRTRDDGAYLVGASGRLYFALENPAAAARRAHRLTLDLHCALPEPVAAQVEIAGVAVSVPCGSGLARAIVELPAGLLGARRFEEVRISRPVADWREWLATAAGLRARALEARALRLDAVDPP